MDRATTLSTDREITPEYENRVYSYYGLQRATTTEEPGAYEAYLSAQQTQVRSFA